MIRTERLTKRYGPLAAVDDLTLDVPAGEVFCFLGPNGAGKTTTIKMLTGLVRPTSGRAWIDGIDIARDPVAAKRRIGYIPDMPFLYDRLTVAEFAEFSGELYGLDGATIGRRTEEMFALFGLDDSRALLVRDLSHGMRQRLLYAATLLRDPPVLFVDEPLIGLDPYTIRTIKGLLRQRARDGRTVFLTTHILALAEEIAGRIGLIFEGRLVALGTLTELLSGRGAANLEELFLSLTGRDPATL
jgi:ABC-2 type transport system ATP-binding protein